MPGDRYTEGDNVTIRIGLVGAGANTKLRHIPGFLDIDGVEISAVCNRTLESGQKVADEYGIGKVFDDWRALVDDDDVDAVCVGTWPYLHAPVTLAALAAGKHLLTEARMAMNLDEARAMLRASEQSESVAMIVPAPFYLEFERTLLDMLEAGRFGEILEIQVSGMAGSYDPGSPITWRQRRELSGNNIMTMGIFNETVRRYAGHERTVTALGKTFIETRPDTGTGSDRAADIPDSLGVVAEHMNGAMCVYHFSSVARPGRNATFEFYGTEGAFRLENGKGWIADGSTFVELEIPPEKRGGWRVERDFVDAIREGRPVTHTSLKDGVNYMEFTEAVQISMREGRTVELPLS